MATTLAIAVLVVLAVVVVPARPVLTELDNEAILESTFVNAAPLCVTALKLVFRTSSLLTSVPSDFVACWAEPLMPNDI